MHETCQSCGRDDDLTAVRRVYLATSIDAADRPADGGDPRSAPIVDDDVEQWCAGCRHTYPHMPID